MQLNLTLTLTICETTLYEISFIVSSPKVVVGDWIRKFIYPIILSCVLSQEAKLCFSSKTLWGHGDMCFSTLAPKPTEVSQTPRIITVCPAFHLISFSKSAHVCLSHWGFAVWHQCAEVYRMYIFSCSGLLWCLLVKSVWNKQHWCLVSNFSCVFESLHYFPSSVVV